MSIEAILFDFDGVILNSEHVWYKAFNETLKQFNFAPVSFQKYAKECKGNYIDENIKTFFGEQKKDKILSIKKIYHQNFLNLLPGLDIFPHAIDLLKTIKNKGYKTAMITSTDSDLLFKTLEHFDIKRYFNVIITGDIVERRKPFPDPVLLGCKKLNVKPQNTIFIGDTKNDVLAGKSAGATVVAIAHTSTHKELAGADYIISSLDELKKIVFNQ